MDKQQVIDALKKAKDISPKRNFKQSIDLIINLKDIDLKKPEHQVNQFLQLHYQRGKKVSVCALIGSELQSQAKEVCDEVIIDSDFGKYNKKGIKKLADKHDFFIAQATIMPKVATVFGRILGPRGKMPNPKAGCVVPPSANLKPLYEKLQKTIKVATKNDPIIQCMVGKEEMKDEEVIDNFLTVYNSVIHALPNEENNVKDVYIKLTMGKPVKIGQTAKAEEKKGRKPKKKEPKKAEEAKTEVKEEKPKEEPKKAGKKKPEEKKEETPSEQ